MIKDNPEFNDLSLEKQFHQCFSIWRISTVGKRATIKQISIFNNNIDDDIKNYDIEYGFVKSEYVEINGVKRLSL